jgi:hypothetical protein
LRQFPVRDLFNRYPSILAGVGFLFLCDPAFAGECTPMEAIDRSNTLYYYEPGQPAQRKTLDKNKMPARVCGLSDVLNDRYVICLMDKQVLVMRSQFRTKTETSVPPPPQEPSHGNHAGVLASVEAHPTSAEISGAITGSRVLQSANAQATAHRTHHTGPGGQNNESQSKAARPPMSIVDNACACKTARPNDCD